MKNATQQQTDSQQKISEQAETPNREYKDTLFKFIFGREENKKWLLSLYNALAGTSYTNENEIELNTIESILYITRKNDVSFLIGSEMYLFEHQSTFSPNLSLRGLVYFAKLYSKYIETHKDKNLYGTQVFRIPAPKFYVIYNGISPFPDKSYLKLSDAFETPSEGFEWTATMLNINYNHNKTLLDACKSLQDYALYVNMVRENETVKKMPREAAINAALNEAIRLNLLEGFFRIHKAEVKEVCFLEEEFDIKGYAAKISDEAVHDSKLETAKKMLAEGIPINVIIKCTELPLDEVTKLQEEVTA